MRDIGMWATAVALCGSLATLGSAGAGCGSDSVKDDFLNDVRDSADALELPEVTDGTSDDGTSGDATIADGTADATTPDGTTPDATTPDGTTPDGVADAEVETSEPVDTASPEVVIPSDDIVGFGWQHGFPVGTSVGAPFAFGDAIGVPTAIAGTITVRAWGEDGAGRFATAAISGTSPTIGGAAACDGNIYVTGTESDKSKAFVTRLDGAGANLKQLSFFPKVAGSGSVSLGPARCGGAGAYFVFDPVGDVTYKAPAGGVVQLTADYVLNRNFIVDAIAAFGDVGTLSSVSATSMGIVRTAAGAPNTLFYAAEARVQRVIGSKTLEPGDGLVYSHDYVQDSGGTATSRGWFGAEDMTALAAHPTDGRFAVGWRDAEGAHLTAFTAGGDAIGTADYPVANDIRQLVWSGDSIVIGGQANGGWLAVVDVSAAMITARSAVFSDVTAMIGDLVRVNLSGECEGSGWAFLGRSATDLRVSALGDDGGACRSPAVAVTGAGTVSALLVDPGSDWVLASSGGVRLSASNGVGPIGPWPDDDGPFVGLVRARVVFAGH